MSTSLYLYCTLTRQCVHAAEIGGNNGVRGPDYPGALGLFCEAHEGLELRCGSSEEIDFWTESVEPFDNEYVLWSASNAAAAYARLPLLR
jgi:hypothetical protein